MEAQRDAKWRELRWLVFFNEEGFFNKLYSSQVETEDELEWASKAMGG